MGKPIRSKANYDGRNFDVGYWDDRQYVRCSRCGFICHTDRDRHGEEGGREGWGTIFERIFTDTNIPSATIQEIDYGIGASNRILTEEGIVLTDENGVAITLES